MPTPFFFENGGFAVTTVLGEFAAVREGAPGNRVAQRWHKAGDLVRETAKIVGGGGGGRPDFAQAGGKDPAQIDAAVEKFYALVGAA